MFTWPLGLYLESNQNSDSKVHIHCERGQIPLLPLLPVYTYTHWLGCDVCICKHIVCLHGKKKKTKNLNSVERDNFVSTTGSLHWTIRESSSKANSMFESFFFFHLFFFLYVYSSPPPLSAFFFFNGIFLASRFYICPWWTMATGQLVK